MKKALAVLLCLIVCVSVMACAKKNEENEETADAYAVTYNGIELALGADAASVLAKLGEPSFEQEVFDCGEGNSRMCYRYASLVLYTMKNTEGKETIDQIEVNDDLVETEQGIAIGSSEAELEEAHGAPTNKTDGAWTYTSGAYQMIFDIENGQVSGIGLLRKTK